MPRNVTKVAIIGGGLMGSGIATSLLLSHCPVVLKEVNEKFLNAGIDRIKDNLHSLMRKGKMTKDRYEKTLSLLTGVLDYERFKNVDLVIEAVIEDVKLKQQIFVDLERHCPSHCILATNTSTIDLNLIGQKTNCQNRIVGAHFFSPAHIMPLLEIVRSKHTSPQVVIDLLDVGKKIKKTPIVVRNRTGFAVNRMFFPYTQTAVLLVDRGMDVYKIDHACTQFGMPVSPFSLTDPLATGKQYAENIPDRFYKSVLIPPMIEDNRTGEASEKGFYKYDDNRKSTPDPEVSKYAEMSRRVAGASPDPEIMKLDNKDIAEMLFFPSSTRPAVSSMRALQSRPPTSTSPLFSAWDSPRIGAVSCIGRTPSAWRASMGSYQNGRRNMDSSTDLAPTSLREQLKVPLLRTTAWLGAPF